MDDNLFEIFSFFNLDLLFRKGFVPSYFPQLHINNVANMGIP